MRFFIVLILAMIGVLFQAPSAVRAAEGVAPDAGKLRVNIAGRQRMLSQRFVKNACLSQVMGPQPAILKGMNIAKTDFEAALADLWDGNDDLGLSPETSPRITTALTQLSDAWAKLARTGAVSRTNASLDPVRLAAADEQGLEVLTIAHKTTGLMAQFYASGATHPQMLQVVNLAGRQRMLSQKMAKEACLIAAGVQVQKNLRAMQGTVDQFDTALTDLRQGNYEKRLPEPPSESIRLLLEEAAAEWTAVRALADTILENGRAEDAAVMQFAQMSNDLLRRMHAIVLAFEAL